MIKRYMSIMMCAGIFSGLFSASAAEPDMNATKQEESRPNMVNSSFSQTAMKPETLSQVLSKHTPSAQAVEHMVDEDTAEVLSESECEEKSQRIEEIVQPPQLEVRTEGVKLPNESVENIKANVVPASDGLDLAQLNHYLNEPELQDLIERYENSPCLANEVLYNIVKGAKDGSVADQAALGDMYRTGFEVKQDYSKAIFWYRIAASKNNANAQYCLSYMYAMGLGVPQSYAEAAKWSEKAAEQNHSMAEFMLGNLYLKGLSVPQNITKAVECFKRAAKQDNPDALYVLAMLYANGFGVQNDYMLARHYLEQGAKHEHLQSMRMLGSFYFLGRGGNLRIEEAMDLWAKACAKGDQKSCSMMNW